MANRARKTRVRRPGENPGRLLAKAAQKGLLLPGAKKEPAVGPWRPAAGPGRGGWFSGAGKLPRSWRRPPRRLVQAVDSEARSLIGESDDLGAPEPSFPFVPRIARLPRDRALAGPSTGTATGSGGERPSLPAPGPSPGGPRQGGGGAPGRHGRARAEARRNPMREPAVEAGRPRPPTSSCPARWAATATA
ncbi:hypothetical protein SGLAM104S_00073 [Streptomyces glaucescens]